MEETRGAKAAERLNNPQLTDYSAKRETKTIRNVRGKAKGKTFKLSSLWGYSGGSAELLPNHLSDVQSKMAWFARFSESAQCLFRKWMRTRTSIFTFTRAYATLSGRKLQRLCPTNEGLEDCGQKCQLQHDCHLRIFFLCRNGTTLCPQRSKCRNCSSYKEVLKKVTH